MLKISRRKAFCNHFEITSILIIELMLHKCYSNENCVVWMLTVMLIHDDFFQILFSQRERRMCLKHL